MDWILYLVASLFCLLGLAAVASIVVSVPGAWILLALALLVELLDSLYLTTTPPQTFNWWLLGVCTLLVLVSELIEFAAGAAGAKAGGGGQRGMFGALIGGVVGAILCTFLLPIIPVIGTLIGALLGTFAGAVVGETSGPQARTMSASIKPALGATIGRIAGTVAKLAIAITVWVVLSFAAFWP